jgi:hypothetical protein
LSISPDEVCFDLWQGLLGPGPGQHLRAKIYSDDADRDWHERQVGTSANAHEQDALCRLKIQHLHGSLSAGGGE